MNTAATIQPRNGTPQAPPRPSRMLLDKVSRGRVVQPLRVLLYGVEGVGKSTFAANAPAPLFLGPEDGTANLDIARFPEPHTWAEVFEAVTALGAGSHEFKTLVLDTVDWLEPLCWRHVCAAARKPDIESFGFGKGYVAALEEWRSLVHALDTLRRTRGMNVVLLAHAIVRPFKNPEGDDYDRFTLKIHDKAAGLLKEWCDAVLFAHYETFTTREDGSRGRAKGVGSGARIIHTSRRPAFDAKNRFDLDERLPLDWSAFSAQVSDRGPAAAQKLRALCAEGVEKLRTAGHEIADKAAAYLEQAGTDLSRLNQLHNRITVALNDSTEETR